MRLRPYVLRTLVSKDIARLVRNGPALMLLGLMVIVAFLVGSSGFVEEEAGGPAVSQSSVATWIVYWEDDEWVQFLKRRAPQELGIRFVEFAEIGSEHYTAPNCVIELRPPLRDANQEVTRRHVQYRYPGSDPNVLWSVSRWFLAASVEHFGQVPPLFQTIRPFPRPSQPTSTRSALEDVSVADILSLSLVGTALLTTILFFAACGLLVSLTAEERERGTLRALLLTPASYLEFVLAKAVVHGGLALATSALVMLALRPEVLGSLSYWAIMATLTCGYFAVGLLISAFAKNQAAPNLLSFAYLLIIGALNLLGYRFEAFRFLSSLTFERYGLTLTLVSLNNPDLSIASTLELLLSQEFLRLLWLSTGWLLIATFIGSRRMPRG